MLNAEPSTADGLMRLSIYSIYSKVLARLHTSDFTLISAMYQYEWDMVKTTKNHIHIWQITAGHRNCIQEVKAAKNKSINKSASHEMDTVEYNTTTAWAPTWPQCRLYLACFDLPTDMSKSVSPFCHVKDYCASRALHLKGMRGAATIGGKSSSFMFTPTTAQNACFWLRASAKIPKPLLAHRLTPCRILDNALETKPQPSLVPWDFIFQKILSIRIFHYHHHHKSVIELRLICPTALTRYCN